MPEALAGGFERSVGDREAETVQKFFGENFRIRLKYVDASERFLGRLVGVIDPEQKRKIIGEEFIRVFEASTKASTRASPESTAG